MRFTTLGTNFSMATQREIDPAWHLDVRHFQRHESHEEKTFCLRAHGFRPSWLSESHISHIIFFRQKAFNFCQSSSSSFFSSDSPSFGMERRTWRSPWPNVFPRIPGFFCFSLLVQPPAATFFPRAHHRGFWKLCKAASTCGQWVARWGLPPKKRWFLVKIHE